MSGGSEKLTEPNSRGHASPRSKTSIVPRFSEARRTPELELEVSERVPSSQIFRARIRLDAPRKDQSSWALSPVRSTVVLKRTLGLGLTSARIA